MSATPLQQSRHRRYRLYGEEDRRVAACLQHIDELQAVNDVLKARLAETVGITKKIRSLLAGNRNIQIELARDIIRLIAVLDVQ